MATAPETRIVEALRLIPEITRLWLFGSRARGDHMPKADIDLAVEFASGVAPDRWFDIVEAADAATLYKVDVVRLDVQPAELRNAVLREGRILYEHH